MNELTHDQSSLKLVLKKIIEVHEYMARMQVSLVRSTTYYKDTGIKRIQGWQ